MPTIELTDEDITNARLWLRADQHAQPQNCSGPSHRDAMENWRDGVAKTIARQLAPKIARVVDPESPYRVHMVPQRPHSVPIEQADLDEVEAQRRSHESLEAQPGVGTGQVVARVEKRMCPRCFGLPSGQPCLVCSDEGQVERRAGAVTP